jgi:hypothetical protein
LRPQAGDVNHEGSKDKNRTTKCNTGNQVADREKRKVTEGQ